MFYFTASGLTKIHDYVIASLGGVAGPLNDGNVQAAAERPRTMIYHEEPFEDIVAKGAALCCALNKWHGFLDGNKRTALLSMILMLEMNGVTFTNPPYITKYLLLVAQDKCSEEEFELLVRKLSSGNRVVSALKEFRYSWLPNLHFNMLGYLPFGMRFRIKLQLDWLAAGDAETLGRVYQEYDDWQEQGYPKYDVDLPIDDDIEKATKDGDILIE